MKYLFSRKTIKPVWIQFITYFVLSDFIEWCVHNLLHRVSWMWEFHKLHHSIIDMDWIGNFRFHWMEIIIYRAAKYFPLVVLGVNSEIIFSIAESIHYCFLLNNQIHFLN